MKNSPVCDDIHPVFVALGITRDILDQVCDIMDQLTRVLEDGKRRLKPYQADKASDLESLDLLIGRLPPKNALALAVALMRIAEVVPDSPSDAEKQAVAFKKYRNNLYAIRDKLHVALDGVV